VQIHYYADSDKRIWTHLSIAFGLIYAVILTANYMFHLIMVIPSIHKDDMKEIMDKMVEQT